MEDRIVRIIFIVAFCMSLFSNFAINSVQAAVISYTAVNLGTISNMDSWANDINNTGQIVGFMQSSAAGPSRAFLYDQGTLFDLGGNFGGSSSAASINNSGTIVGQAQSTNHGGYTGFQISGNTVTDLFSTNNARSINENGDIVGNTSSLSENRAYLNINGSTTDIHAAIYGVDSYANAVNSNQQVAGYFLSYTSGNHAYIYDHGTVTDLAPLLGGQSWAYGINEGGKVVGYTDSHGGEAFLYNSGTVQFLGPWQARGINAAGQVVGGGFLYDNGSSYDLLSLLDSNDGWSGIQAYAINDISQIVGYGYFNGAQRAVLLNPVPEPRSLALFLIGLCVAAKRRSYYINRSVRR